MKSKMVWADINRIIVKAYPNISYFEIQQWYQFWKRSITFHIWTWGE
jgi:hypothetical protein